MLIKAELKHFSVNMRFLANYVQSFHRLHYVCDFCFFSSRKRRNNICLFFVFSFSILLLPPARRFNNPFDDRIDGEGRVLHAVMLRSWNEPELGLPVPRLLQYAQQL